MDVLEKVEKKIIPAGPSYNQFIPKVTDLIYKASQKEGSGIALRTEEYLIQKLFEEKVIMAFVNDELAGFCYIETWDHGKYIANSGLIIDEAYRGLGIAKEIKKSAFNLSRIKYPEAKMFGLTTSLAVMKINSSLGYVPVTFSELTSDNQFWKGCETCKYYDILVRTKKESCLCTAMVYDPKKVVGLHN